MSHELRTPLNVILGFAQLLELDDLADDQRENLAHILSGAWHLLARIVIVGPDVSCATHVLGDLQRLKQSC
jgi:signal transduction histidine kinase